jgi:hypothetical protein
MNAALQTQRSATMAGLQELTRLTLRADDGGTELAGSLVLDSLVFRSEAEIRWLDHGEARIARAAGPSSQEPGVGWV